MHFSSRLRWNLNPNPLSRLIVEKRAAGAQIIDLTESNPTHANLAYPWEQIQRALASPSALAYEPHPAGMREAREAVSRYYGGRVAPDRILLTASTSEAYGFLFKLLADPGDEVLVPRPSYPLFEFLAELESVKVVQYPLRYDHGWMIDFDALEDLLTAKTRAIVLVNPNNPTGSFLKSSELPRLRWICERHNLAIISDEVFADFGFVPDAQRIPTLTAADNLPAFSLSGLSKIAGLPQMKLAWIVVPDSGAFTRLELIADTYLSVNTPVQCAAATLLRARTVIQNQIRQRTAANLGLLRGRVEGTPFSILDVEAGWYATLQVPRIHSEEEWALELLRRENVLVQPGFFYDFEREAFLVLSLLTPEEDFSEGTARLLALV